MAQLTLSSQPDGFIPVPSDVKKLAFEQGEELALPFLHAKSISCGAALVIVPQQVQNTMKQQEVELVLKGQAGFGGVAGGGVGRDDDVAEQIGLYPRPL